MSGTWDCGSKSAREGAASQLFLFSIVTTIAPTGIATHHHDLCSGALVASRYNANMNEKRNKNRPGSNPAEAGKLVRLTESDLGLILHAIEDYRAHQVKYGKSIAVDACDSLLKRLQQPSDSQQKSPD